MNRFQQLFANPAKKAFIPFFTLGDPDLAMSLELIKLAIDNGCDALELGIPFSDPIADGPVIQASAIRALKAGANFAACCELIRKIRDYNQQIPIGLLIYANLLYRPGYKEKYAKLAASGIDAILAVDIPVEEAAEHENFLQEFNLGCIELIAPNTPLARVKQLLTHCNAFAYVVSDYGTTGVRLEIPMTTLQRLKQFREIADTPLVVGFGINQAEQVKQIFDNGGQGAIIGSAIIKIIERHLNNIPQMKKEVAELIKSCCACRLLV